MGAYLTTDQEVGGSNPPGRATLPLKNRQFLAVLLSPRIQGKGQNMDRTRTKGKKIPDKIPDTFLLLHSCSATNQLSCVSVTFDF